VNVIELMKAQAESEGFTLRDYVLQRGMSAFVFGVWLAWNHFEKRAELRAAQRWDDDGGAR